MANTSTVLKKALKEKDARANLRIVAINTVVVIGQRVDDVAESDDVWRLGAAVGGQIRERRAGRPPRSSARRKASQSDGGQAREDRSRRIQEMAAAARCRRQGGAEDRRGLQQQAPREDHAEPQPVAQETRIRARKPRQPGRRAQVAGAREESYRPLQAQRA